MEEYPNWAKTWSPERIFLTKGVGKHKERLTSFELALRDAGIAAQNLVRVSSIFPPNCKLINRAQGLKYLNPGEVVFAVVAENSTREPHRLVASSIGLAQPRRPQDLWLFERASQLWRNRPGRRRLRRGAGGRDAGHHARRGV